MSKNKEFEEWYDKNTFMTNYASIETLSRSVSLLRLLDILILTEYSNVKKAYELYQHERDKHRWIPVTERLPDFDNSYYGAHIEQDVNIKIQSDFENEVYVIPAVFDYYKRTFKYDESLYPDSIILAWQPLPEE